MRFVVRADATVAGRPWRVYGPFGRRLQAVASCRTRAGALAVAAALGGRYWTFREARDFAGYLLDREDEWEADAVRGLLEGDVARYLEGL